MTDDPRATARLGLLRAYREAGTTAWLEATGVSMRPLIPPGSRLLVEFGARDARIGEVILFERRGGVVAHRVVGSRGRASDRRLVAKGDGEAHIDRPVSPTDVLGVVRAVRLHDGRVVTAGLGGRQGAGIARASGWAARSGRLIRAAARRLPGPWRPMAEARAASLSRVPTRVLMASIPRLDRERSTERR